MKEYTVTDPKFTDSISIVETTDPAHADNVNAAPKAIFENTVYLKKRLETAIYVKDTEPEGVNYLWFAPVNTVTEVDVSEVVLETVAYTDTEDKLHVETDGETATVDNSTVADGEVTIS